MLTNRVFIYRLGLVICLAAGAMVVPLSSVAGDKIRPEEIVAKHLEAIGPAETRSSAHSRIVAGTAVVLLHSPGTAKFTGRVVLASDGSKNMIGTAFEGGGQFQDRFAFDGGNVTIGMPAPGIRGLWGGFINSYQNIVKEGLVGGGLSDSWPLGNVSEKKAKLEYRGTKKIDGKPVHEIKYIPRGSSDLEISLFFDTTTFQHVRTEYTRVVSAAMGAGIDASGQQKTTRYKMVEDFSDFRPESGLVLPHTYKVALELDTRNGTTSVDWEFTLTDFAFNQAIPATTFNLK